MSSALLIAFRAHAGSSAMCDARGIEAALRSRVEEGATAWPSVALDQDVFVRHLARHSFDGELPPFEHAAEMWLACACAHGVGGAARAFIRDYQSVVERAVCRIDRSLKDDITQLVLMSLLLPAGERSSLEQYAGRSRLSTWLTTLTLRATVRQRSLKGHVPQESTSGVTQLGRLDSPDIALTRARYGAAFDLALREALAALVHRDRTLLKLHHARGWSIDRLGAFYGVGRSTAARWLIQARESLYGRTRASLMDTLGITSTEFLSLAKAVVDDLETSLIRLLEEEASTPSV